jgi:histidinol-phosphatase (PHP family)
LERCRRQFAGQLVIRAGIEIGEPHLFSGDVRRMMTRFPFDYAIGSLHWVGSDSIFSPRYFTLPARQAYGRYFAELERMTREGEFEVLGHLDVPVRTAFDIYGGYEAHAYEDMVRPVLQACIEREIALEINAGTLRRRAGVLTPGLPILKWYAEMGGTQLTLGSDAHRPGQVAAGLNVALDAARAAGLHQLTQLEKREKRLIAL